MSFCQQCGAQLDENAKFCAKCGFAINSVSTTSNSKEVERKASNNTSKIIIAVAAIVILVLVAIIVILLGKNGDISNSTNALPGQIADNTEGMIDEGATEDSQEDMGGGSVVLTADNIIDYYGHWNAENGCVMYIGPDSVEGLGYTEFSIHDDGNWAGFSIKNSEINWDMYEFKMEDADGFEYNICLNITEEGIYAEGLGESWPQSWPERTLFTQKGFKEPEGSREGAYNDGKVLYVFYQYSDDTHTYLETYATGEDPFIEGISTIVSYEGKLDRDYTDYYIVAEEQLFYPDLYLKGYPVHEVDLSSSYILSSDEYWASVEYYEEDYYYDDYYYDDYYDESYYNVDTLVPPADFNKDYDACFYDAATGLWVFANTATNMRPFKMTGVDLLEWTPGNISFIGRIQNQDAIEHKFVELSVILCGEGGKVLQSYTSSKIRAFYDPNGYTIVEGEKAGWMTKLPYLKTTAEDEDPGTWEIYTIPAGAEAYFTIGGGNLRDRNISDITEQIKYIYVVLEDFE